MDWMQVIKQSVAIGVAGFFGALSRVLVGTMVGKVWASAFPLGTLIVNVSGCLLLGAFYAYAAEGRSGVSETVRTAIGVGFVGAYTTFSTLMYDVNGLWSRGDGYKAVGNLVLSLALGIVAVRVGIFVGRRL